MEDIANGVTSNVFTAVDSAALSGMTDDLFNGICGLGRMTVEPRAMKKIVNQFIYEAASKFKNQFSAIPNWLPNYQLWKKGKIPYFTYERKDA